MDGDQQKPIIMCGQRRAASMWSFSLASATSRSDFPLNGTHMYEALRCDFTARDPLLAAAVVRVEWALLDTYLSIVSSLGMVNIQRGLSLDESCQSIFLITSIFGRKQNRNMRSKSNVINIHRWLSVVCCVEMAMHYQSCFFIGITRF